MTRAVCRVSPETNTIAAQSGVTLARSPPDPSSGVYYLCNWKERGRSAVKVRDVIKRIESNGWYLARTRGGHRHYMHPTKKGIVTISGQLGKDMPIGTLLSVFKQAQIERERENG